MRIVTVIPLEKGLPASNLSYFTKEEVLPGAVVSVPVRSKEIPALVIDSRQATELKAETRALNFPLKKMARVIHPALFRPEFIHAAEDSARFFIAPLGQVIKTFSPKSILQTPTSYRPSKSNGESEEKKRIFKPEITVIQEDDEERLSLYKSLIRETFAKKASVLLCLPTIVDIEKTVSSLGKGIGSYTIILHSKLAPKEQLANWHKAADSTHPVLIVVTPGFLAIPRSDLAVIILDRENSSHYKDQVKPFIDARIFIEYLARHFGAKLILGDIALRAETVLRAERGDLVVTPAFKYRVLSDANQNIISIKENFSVVSEKLARAIEKSHKNSERFFLLAGRRGLAPITTCNDCGEILTCTNCSAPLVLHGTDAKHYFNCHRCGQTSEVEDKCPQCGSWRLAVLGIGIDNLHKEMGKIIPKTSLFRIDSDTVKNTTKAKKEVASFYKTPGSVLVGTEMALDYLTDQVENTGIAGLDSLFALPDFKINEKIMALVLRTRSLALKKFYIQTRRPEEKVFTEAIAGNLLDFYREEIADRKQLNYPPFTVLIKIARDIKDKKAIAEMGNIAKDLLSWDPKIYESKGEKGAKQISCLIRVNRDNWPNNQLVEKLISLPPEYLVVIDPESLV